MATQYRIYSNHGTGGPVDLSDPVVTTAALSCVLGPVAPSADYSFLVRAFDTVTGLEECNTVAAVRVIVAPDGSEAGAVPNPPHAVTLSSVSGGGGSVGWAYAPAAGAGVPERFNVYLSEGPAVDYAAPTATVPYVPGRVGYSCLITGPLPPATYSAAVRATNSAGSEANTSALSRALGRSTVPYVMDKVQTVAAVG